MKVLGNIVKGPLRSGGILAFDQYNYNFREFGAAWALITGGAAVLTENGSGVLSIGAQNTSPASLYERRLLPLIPGTSNGVIVSGMSLDFRVDAANPDDAAVFFFENSTLANNNVGVSPRRETAIDPQSRINLGWASVNYPIGTGPIPIGQWHRVVCGVIQNPLRFAWRIVNLDTGVLFNAGEGATTVASVRVNNMRVNADAGGLTCPAQYRNAKVWG